MDEIKAKQQVVAKIKESTKILVTASICDFEKQNRSAKADRTAKFRKAGTVEKSADAGVFWVI